MAEKKKLSVAEILAAARKADGGSSAAPESAPPASPEGGAAESSESAPAEAVASETPAAPKPAAPKASGGARLSVAEMLKAARAQGAAGAAPAAAKPAAKPAVAKEAAPKKEAPKKEAPAKGPVMGVAKDTASILAAARGASKPGPITKAEAALKPAAKPAPAKAAKEKIIVPPMPVKPEYAKPKVKAPVEDRRGFLTGVLLGSFLAVGFVTLSANIGLWTLGMVRFMFPNILTEPPSKFKVGFPSNFAPGQVETKFVPMYGVWVCNYEYNGQPQVYALRTVCTHLGCTPNWLEGEQKFKCPCHGSGFYKDGINFEGPAPRPLERYAIRLADDGQLEVDKSKIFQEEIGQWNDPSSYVPV
jgi:cytochrome b6-f complex iron-sulfur subunit